MKKVITILLTVAMIFVLSGCGGGTNTPVTTGGSGVVAETNEAPVIKEETPTQKAGVPAPDSKYYFQDNVLQIEDARIEITDVKIIHDDVFDVPAIEFFYTITNLSDEPLDASMAWIVCFQAVQDNDPNVINKLEVGGTPEEFRDSQFAQIKPGGTTQNAMTYQLTDETTPVTLIATRGIAGEELGQQEYPVQ